VIASVDTYLRFAEAVNRLDLSQTEAAGINELRNGGSKAGDKAKGAMEGVKEKVSGKD
jgi:gas vesicle structural protein